jgi:hypothetical protein
LLPREEEEERGEEKRKKDEGRPKEWYSKLYVR